MFGHALANLPGFAELDERLVGLGVLALAIGAGVYLIRRARSRR